MYGADLMHQLHPSTNDGLSNEELATVPRKDLLPLVTRPASQFTSQSVSVERRFHFFCVLGSARMKSCVEI